MTRWVDVVNFNADASCLDTARWLSALEGGEESEFCRWLRLYVELGRKIVLGLTGATIADVEIHNPEAKGVLRENPAIFEAVVRPFSHDIALIRASKGFSLNLELGARAIGGMFSRVSQFYLPPEFMLSNEQVAILAASGYAGIFVNASRLASDMRARVPDRPYQVRGLGGTRLPCLPVRGRLTDAYLDALHRYDPESWNDALRNCEADTVVCWRDGESAFLLPDGLERERHWLAGERCGKRAFLSQIESEYLAPESLAAEHLQSYPVHSFLAWMKEFRMMGYLGRLHRMETEPHTFSTEQLVLWLQAINSDVMSAVEKRSPQIALLPKAGADAPITHTLFRAERGFEGEECLALLERSLEGDAGAFERFIERGEPLSRKVRGRHEYLRRLNK
ncbi:MAG: hypothetical protein NFCOHLIN_02930 [Gammaproteobacteria bacterium]|nr:hypothetical protein [Gammaproteobacteria bacterium]